jgi:hypothetical protein
MGRDYPFHSDPFGHYRMDPRRSLHERFWMRVASLAIAAGVTPLAKRAGLWTLRVCDDWTLHVNGHPFPLGQGREIVPPVSCLVRFRGKRAGVLYHLDPTHTLAAGMEDLVAALERFRLRRVFSTGK